MQWWEFIKADNKRLNKTYKQGGYKPREKRGFPGIKLGPANEGRTLTLSEEEKQKIIDDLENE